MAERALEAQIEGLTARVDAVLTIKDCELPECQKDVARNASLVQKMLMFVVRKFCDRKERLRKKALFDAVRRNATMAK